MNGLWRSERQHAPTQSLCANEFVEELWEKIRVGTKEAKSSKNQDLSQSDPRIDISKLNPSRKDCETLSVKHKEAVAQGIMMSADKEAKDCQMPAGWKM